MAYFDAKTGEVVVRIVYDGLGTAGKTTNLRQLHAAFPSRTQGGLITPSATEAGRTLYFDWLELVVGHIDDVPLRCQILTVPGQFVFAHRRFHLLRDLDGVVLVCDSTEHGVRAGKIAASFLARALDATKGSAVPVVLQANKQDLPGALAAPEVALALPLRFSAVIGAVAETGEGVRTTLIRALDLARAGVRARLADGAHAALPPCAETAEELYARLLATDGDAHGADLVEALEESLGLLE